jgi:outer membrane protein assembly factor BamB
VTAVDAANGAERWTAALQRSVVNASPAVSGDLGPSDRAFITDYDGLGGSGRLYCVNVDPFDPVVNPHEPGAIVWSVVLGTTSGNSPAYAGGVVYVAGVADETGASPGIVRAYPAGATSAPSPLWEFVNIADAGFFGGVSVSGGAVFAASYAFAGGQFAGNLVRLDAATGALAWSAPSNRTDATPLPLPGGFVALSGGLEGFGSRPSVQLFRDLGSAAALEWDTALDTWEDVNLNGSMDAGEFLLVGGWTHQPAAAEGDGLVLYAGAVPPGEGGAPCTDVFALDLSFAPGEAGFIAAHRAGAGSTPALSGGWVYTVGAAGLAAFAPPLLCIADCDGSGILDIDDFICFQTLFALGDAAADCDASGGLDIDDFVCFQTFFAVGCP